MAIAAQVHTSLPERPDVFAEKIRLAPQFCFTLSDGHEVTGYGLAHPWLLRAVPAIDDYLHRLPESPDCLYVHDIAILPSARGRGASAALLDRLASEARKAGLPVLACVSVYGTRVHWERFGFRLVNEPSLTSKLAIYGPTACYMMMAVDGPQR